ncbi:hypothetical protein RhiirA1_395239 [Rhizophagus irregularis]|uniref:Uncharacterized protein n=1 Tax=Rhizophagus irregularis TaxID=588596 RepID=A0A2N0RQD0_9GLOM|nr:hypothetical protein RhiirA1_395239 [Rhizophagus irregularis]CAB4481485.1 unnamed protein product [Rhizophagus irregularis]
MDLNNALLIGLLIILVGLFAYLSTQTSAGDSSKKQENMEPYQSASDQSSTENEKGSCSHNCRPFKTPEEILSAERMEELENSENIGGTESYEFNNKKGAYEQQQEGPSVNYENYLEKLVIDNEAQENHDCWVKDMDPWLNMTNSNYNSGIELDAYIPWQGLVRPEAVPDEDSKYYPQVTEVDSSNFRKEKGSIYDFINN